MGAQTAGTKIEARRNEGGRSQRRMDEKLQSREGRNEHKGREMDGRNSGKRGAFLASSSSCILWSSRLCGFSSFVLLSSFFVRFVPLRFFVLQIRPCVLNPGRRQSGWCR